MRKKVFNVKNIIFDMDGVITNTMPDHFKAWKIVLAKEDIPVTHFDVYSREGQRGEQAVIEIFEHYKKPLSKTKLKKVLKDKEDVFKRVVKTRFVVGSRTFIHNLKQNGFSLALVTGTSLHELKKILPKHISELFCVIITADNVKKGKPDPEPYKKALKKLKSSSVESIVIENAPFGIRSAKGAGLRTIALETSLPRKYLTGADYVFSSIKEMSKKIKFILRH